MSGIIRVKLAVPLIGSKAFLVDSKHTFVLEEGPGTLQAIAVTHAGSGVMMAIDGVPDDNGFFPGGTDDFTDAATAPDEWWERNGRPLYKANPIVMGMWQLQAGFFHGLTIRVAGGQVESASPIATIVWMPYRRREAATTVLAGEVGQALPRPQVAAAPVPVGRVTMGDPLGEKPATEPEIIPPPDPMAEPIEVVAAPTRSMTHMTKAERVAERKRRAARFATE